MTKRAGVIKVNVLQLWLTKQYTNSTSRIIEMMIAEFSD